ncbi:hypothetical protein [Streptomyces sp. 8N706]|uniref:hypothetical protein n=1 Tax=Streptomyces sp. 8N706 TaxID=3457416 RepID=UPI003FD385D7
MRPTPSPWTSRTAGRPRRWRRPGRSRRGPSALTPAAVPLPTTLTATFGRYAELTGPCWIEAERMAGDGSGSITRVSGHQDGEELFSCTLVTSELLG